MRVIGVVQFIGQPVLIGGTMGTCSYVLTGTQRGMDECFGSTCHGAGRAQSRNKSRRALSYQDVLGRLAEQVYYFSPTPHAFFAPCCCCCSDRPTQPCRHLMCACVQGIAIRVASPKLVMEEAPESYKDVSAVVDTCHAAGISNKVIKLRPIAVVKG